MRNFLLILLVPILFFNCQTTRQNETVLIINDSNKDTVTIKFNQAIMELPEYRTWIYNWHSNSGDVIGHSHFESRTLSINDKIFYHIELIKQKNNKPTDSFMYPQEIACYFRVDPTDNKIKILNMETKLFIDLMSEDGRQYFKNCLQND